MKKLLLITSFLFIWKWASAQEAFTGIGIFKIGTDTTVLYNFAKENGLKIKRSNDYNEFLDRGYSFISGVSGKKEVFALINNGKPYKGYEYSYSCPDVLDFIVGKYEVAGITIFNLHLEYLKGKLISASCNPPSGLSSALEAKYGSPTRETLTDTSKCSTTAVATRHKSIWNNGEIKATYDTGERFSYDCKREYTTRFDYRLLHSGFEECIKEYKVKAQTADRSKLKDL